MGFIVSGAARTACRLHKRLPRSFTRRSVLSFSTTNNNETTTTTRETATAQTDVLIVGGGVVGCALARLISLRMPHLSIGLVEGGKGPTTAAVDTEQQQQLQSLIPNPRSYALSPASLQLLGLHDDTTVETAVQKRLGHYSSMQVWESNQPASLLFTESDLPPDSGSYLGAVVEDAVLQNYLWRELDSKNVKIWKETTVANVAVPASPLEPWCELELKSTAAAAAETADPKKMSTKLLVAADGANSHVRNLTGMATAGWDYGQQALTFTVELSRPHAGRAFQRFSQDGVVALLPSFSPNHAIVVWSTTPETVKEYKDSSHLVDHVNAMLQQGPGQLPSLFGDGDSHGASSSSTIVNNLKYGAEQLINTLQYSASMAAQQNTGQFVAPPVLTNVVSQQFAFPLSCKQAQNYIRPRVALVGDAAHSVHPMAGQGLNLGLQDVANLVDVLEKGVAAGMDPATFLVEYEQSRKKQVSLTLSGIHALHQMFGVQDTLAKHVKSLGMNLIQNVGPVRRSLVHAACQGVATPE